MLCDGLSTIEYRSVFVEHCYNCTKFNFRLQSHRAGGQKERIVHDRRDYHSKVCWKQSAILSVQFKLNSECLNLINHSSF